MSIRIRSLIMAAVFLLTACTQRTEAPPTNRDGIAGGANTPPKPATQSSQNGKSKDEPADLPFIGLEEKFELGPDEYTVLVGSFPTEQQAQELAYFLRMYRVSNFVDRVGDEWRVCIGRYRSAKAAQKTLLLLQKRGAIAKLRQSGYEEPTVYGPGHGF